MGHTRQRHEVWNYAGPAAASPIWLQCASCSHSNGGRCFPLAWAISQPCGLQPALPRGSLRRCRAGLAESLTRHTAPWGE